jgi:hypothetical protein
LLHFLGERPNAVAPRCIVIVRHDSLPHSPEGRPKWMRPRCFYRSFAIRAQILGHIPPTRNPVACPGTGLFLADSSGRNDLVVQYRKGHKDESARRMKE